MVRSLTVERSNRIDRQQSLIVRGWVGEVSSRSRPQHATPSNEQKSLRHHTDGIMGPTNTRGVFTLLTPKDSSGKSAGNQRKYPENSTPTPTESGGKYDGGKKVNVTEDLLIFFWWVPQFVDKDNRSKG